MHLRVKEDRVNAIADAGLDDEGVYFLVAGRESLEGSGNSHTDVAWGGIERWRRS